MPTLSDALGNTTAPGQGGFMDALKGFKKFFDAKPGSASNDDKYRKALQEAGIPEGDEGVGK